MKYIVDLPDAYTSESALLGDILRIPICLENGKCYGIPTGIKLEPYTEPDRKAIEDEVWEFARGLINYTDDDWETIINMLLLDIPYQEAKEKYEAWKAEKEEIRVGDEVQYSLAGYEYTFIVFGKENDVLYGMRTDKVDMDATYEAWDYCNKSDSTLEKTGRHFNEVEDLMKKMRKSDD